MTSVAVKTWTAFRHWFRLQSLQVYEFTIRQLIRSNSIEVPFA